MGGNRAIDQDQRVREVPGTELIIAILPFAATTCGHSPELQDSPQKQLEQDAVDREP
jgi:hypothetical protein